VLRRVVEQDDAAAAHVLSVTRRVISAAERPFQSSESTSHWIVCSPHAVHRLDHVFVVLPVGRAEERGAHAGDRLDFVAAAVDVADDLLRCQAG
jgi:hypothetical protein